MARPETALLVITVFYWVAMAEGIEPILKLYKDTNSEGASLTITSATHNLHDFNDEVESICGLGLWFLYDDADFSKKSKFVHVFAASSYRCENLDFHQRNKITSARFAGTNDFNYPTLMLYHDENQCGEERLLLGDRGFLLEFSDEATSFAVTGKSSWTIYDDADYLGDSACLTPGNVGDMYYGLWSDVVLKNDVVSSVRKGCHSDNVFEYNP